jgi:phosphatidate cytidylyltransferase
LVIFKDFNGEDVGKALMVVNYVGLGAASIVILRFLGVRFIVYLLSHHFLRFEF